jgi:lysophospholipid acyltransferase (LPLAT)-like uncharacterized protein
MQPRTRPHRTKSKRRLTPMRLFGYRIAVLLAKMLLELLWWTCRKRFVGKEALDELVRREQAVVPVCWHQHLLMCARFVVSPRSGLKSGFMISPSVDGEAPTMLARSYGAHIVRGSGSYTGVRAVRGAHQAIQDGVSPLITPDGPRGPRFKFKPGAIFAAQISGKRVVPLAFAAKPAFVLDTWDKFVIPVPFGRICIAVGEPFTPAAELGEGEMEAAQRQMEQRMLETYESARKAL